MSIIIDSKFANFDLKKQNLDLDFRPHFDLNLTIGSWNEGLFIRQGPSSGRIGIVPMHPQPGHAKTRSIHRFQKLQFTESDDTYEISWNDPEISLIGPHLNQEVDHPVRQFLETIPPDHLSMASPFGLHQLTILRILRYFPKAKDLLRNEQTLFWLIAHKVLRSGLHPQAIGDILNRKRIKILDWITDGQASMVCLKFINKVVIQYFDRREMKLLWRFIQSPMILDRFRHFPVVSPQVFRTSFQNPELLSCKFFVNAYSCTDTRLPIAIQEVTALWGDAIRVGQQLRIKNYQKIVAACPTVPRLRSLHDKWTAKFNKDEENKRINEAIQKYGTDKFLEPPLSGTSTIIPIDTVKGLLDEGRVMRHCVGSYVDQVFSGISYFYRVTAPERGTLEIYIDHGVPNIKAFSLFENKTPGKDAWESARKWFAKNQPAEKLNRIPIIPKSFNCSDDEEFNLDELVPEEPTAPENQINFSEGMEELEAHISVFGVGRKGLELVQGSGSL